MKEFREAFENCSIVFFLIDGDVWYEIKSLNGVLAAKRITSSWDLADFRATCPPYHINQLTEESVLLNERGLAYWFILVGNQELNELEEVLNRWAQTKKSQIFRETSSCGLDTYRYLNQIIGKLENNNLTPSQAKTYLKLFCKLRKSVGLILGRLVKSKKCG